MGKAYKKQKTGHRAGGRHVGVIAGGAFGKKLERKTSLEQLVYLSELELSMFFRQAVGVPPSEGARVMKKALQDMEDPTLQVALHFINQRLQKPKKNEERKDRKTRELLIGIRRKMLAEMQIRAELAKKRKKKR